jgi:hypothetical protein
VATFSTDRSAPDPRQLATVKTGTWPPFCVSSLSLGDTTSRRSGPSLSTSQSDAATGRHFPVRPLIPTSGRPGGRDVSGEAASRVRDVDSVTLRYTVEQEESDE